MPANEIADALLGRNFWAFTSQAPLRKRLSEGDAILIYLAGPRRRYFVARGEVARESDEVRAHEREVLESLGLSFMPYRVLLRSVRRIDPPVHIGPLILQLDFVTEKRNYGLHLRLPIVRIGREDFELILSKGCPR